MLVNDKFNEQNEYFLLSEMKNLHINKILKRNFFSFKFFVHHLLWNRKEKLKAQLQKVRNNKSRILNT